MFQFTNSLVLGIPGSNLLFRITEYRITEYIGSYEDTNVRHKDHQQTKLE
eukprot:COSAG02_NODE_14827_length_1232_cov_1.434245_2_plen_49_part_01